MHTYGNLKALKIHFLKNHRLLIIATASDQCARAFGMHDLFTSVFDVPPLSTVDHLMAVIEDSEVFTDADYGRLRSRLSERSSRYMFHL